MAVTKAIIVAGGQSKRMHGIDKIFVGVAGKPVLAHTLGVFERSEVIDGVVLVLPGRRIEKGRALIDTYGCTKVETICEGGNTRQQSVHEGLKHIGDCEFVVIHDGDRPCVTREAIEQGIREAEREGVVVAVSPVADTIKQVDEEGRVVRTLDRSRLVAVHTPQVFRAEILRAVHRKPVIDATDDAGLAERMGYNVKVYVDSFENIKITTREDLVIAEAILMRRQGI